MGSKESRAKGHAPRKLRFWTFCTANGEYLKNSSHKSCFSLAKLVSLGDRKGSAEAASVLPQASALRPCTGFVAGWRGGHRGSGKLQPPEDLGSPFLILDCCVLAGGGW